MPAARRAAAMSSADDFTQRLGRMCHRLVIAYDGSAYRGWQLQPAAPTIQAAVENALCVLLRTSRERLGVTAAGRTDAGVHAEGQVRRHAPLHAMPCQREDMHACQV